MLDLVFGCGQGGARLAQVISEVYDIEGRYVNLTDVDFSKFEVPRASIFVLNEGGTGRDPELGERLVRKHKDKLKPFIAESISSTKAKRIALCVGGGGGSGTGFLFPLLEHLLEMKREVMLFYTLPQKREGLPAQPNAIKALNRLIETYIGHTIEKTKQIAPLLIDNDYCYDRYGQDSNEDYWNKVNRGVAFALKRFYNITNLEKHKNYIDIASGYNSLDYREFLRILFFKEGFLDIREIVLQTPKDASSLRTSIKSSSLLNGSMDINTTKAYIVSVALPESWKEKAAVTPMLDIVFDSITKMTRTPFVLRSSYYSQKLKTARISLLLAGMSKSHGIDKHIKSAVKNVEKFKSKGSVGSLNLEGLDF
jgi:hypothetical protein